MILVAFLRHGPTTWNTEKRVQGMTDVPLSDAGRAQVANWALPSEMESWHWHSSPLSRATQTAHLLRKNCVAIVEPALREMCFGVWEGRQLEQLRQDAGAQLQANEAAGLDMMPPGGESPRQVMHRLRAWLAARAGEGRNTIAVTHKGIIRVALAMATGWEMKDRQPVKLDWQSLHIFQARQDGSIAIERLNVSLAAAGERASSS